jgi:serine protease inhibitor
MAIGGKVTLWPSPGQDPFTTDHLLEADANQLNATLVSPHLSAPIGKGTNILWCASFQLAWNEACSLVGENLHFTADDPMVGVLNRKSFTKADIDEGSYVAVADFVRNDIHSKIRKAVEEKFHGTVNPRFIPSKGLTLRPQDFVAYACLFKNLEFKVPFESIDQPLVFSGVKLASFGVGANKSAPVEMYSQVLVLNYKDTHDFVIELKSKSQGDRIILAKVRPAESLAATIAQVRNWVGPTNAQAARSGDILMVPKLNFDVTREYSEIERQDLVVKNSKIAKDLMIVSAIQNTRFQLDEKGARLRSESHMAFACSKAEPTGRIMVFDEPFLILLERQGASAPYFALWVDNPELLVPW